MITGGAETVQLEKPTAEGIETRIVGDTVPATISIVFCFNYFLLPQHVSICISPSSGGIYNFVFLEIITLITDPLFYILLCIIVLQNKGSVVSAIIKKTKLYIPPEDGQIETETCSDSKE
jgi:hypothetical protein